MKVGIIDGKSFQLTAETPEDFDLVGALDHQRSVFVTQVAHTPEAGHWVTSGATLLVDLASPQARSAQADRQARCAIGQVIRLGLSEAADHGHVGALSADPEAQKQLAAGLVQLQTMLDALRDVVGEQEAVIKEMRSAHGNAPLVKRPILAETQIGNQAGRARMGLINLLGGLALVAMLAIGTTLDGPEDHSTDWSSSKELKALQTAEDGSDRQQAAAQALCTKERGPNSEARWTAERHLVCTTRRGVVAAQL